MNSFPSRCYYCNEDDFGSVNGYEHHVVTRHPDMPGYPGPADIEFYKRKRHGTSWEREVKADFKWK
jgi:hypothetical protein